jgi:hypothetical protein
MYPIACLYLKPCPAGGGLPCHTWQPGPTLCHCAQLTETKRSVIALMHCGPPALPTNPVAMQGKFVECNMEAKILPSPPRAGVSVSSIQVQTTVKSYMQVRQQAKSHVSARHYQHDIVHVDCTSALHACVCHNLKT